MESEGVQLDAVVFWSLLGSFDWDDLVRAERGHYESGAFDVRSGALRPTAVATAIRAIAANGSHSHPVLWPRSATRSPARNAATSQTSGYRPILILGAGGTLGRAFIRRCEARHIGWHAMTRNELDISSRSELLRVVGALRPWAVVNASGYVSIDAAELDHITCRRVNVHGAANVAYACQRYDAALVTFSSDLVFDGAKMTPYVESDRAAPLSVYGISKFDGEQAVLAEAPGALVIRTSAFFGNDDKHNFVVQTLGLLASGREVLCSTSVVSPTFVPALADSTLDLLVDGAAGVWHQSSAESLSWSELARSLARLAGFDDQLVRDASQAELGYTGRRPAYSVLGSKRGCPLPELHASLTAVVRTWMSDR
ncbi:NAD(P)-dependent oxidoreductase [Gemmatimonas sp.]